MRRAIVVALAAFVLAVSGCGEAPEDTAQAVAADAPPETTEPAPETTTRPRPTTTTTTSTTSTTTTSTTTTAAPTTTTAPPPPPTTTTAPPPPPTTAAPSRAPGGCDPNYDPCVPIASDVDCSGGSGNGPAYVDGPVRVVGSDPYGLDADGDGVGCEA